MGYPPSDRRDAIFRIDSVASEVRVALAHIAPTRPLSMGTGRPSAPGLHPVTIKPMRHWRLYFGLVAVVLLLAAARWSATFPGDESVLGWFQSQRHPVSTTFMQVVTETGETWFLLGLIGVVILLLLALKKRECVFPLGVLGVMAMGPVLKLLADRPRPPIDLVRLAEPLSGNGFPSGHTFESTLVFGVMIYLASLLIRRRVLRWPVQGTLAALILGVGVSRVYLGAHWPSDVAGGYAIALLVLAAVVNAKPLTSLLSRQPA